MRLRGRVAGGGGRALLAVTLLLTSVACGNQNAGGAGGDSSRSPVRSPAAPRPASDVPPLPTVLFIGTSLTAGLGLEPDSAYPMMVGRKIEAAGLPYAVVNAGVSGETTAGLLSRLDWLLRRRAAVIVVESGANDGLRGVPVATVRQNLGEVLRRVKAAQPDARVLLVQMEAPPNMGATYARAFRETYPAVAKEHGVTLLPFLLDGVAGHAELNQADGIHPNLRGERIVAENVWRGLEPVLRTRPPSPAGQ